MKYFQSILLCRYYLLNENISNKKLERSPYHACHKYVRTFFKRKLTTLSNIVMASVMLMSSLAEVWSQPNKVRNLVRNNYNRTTFCLNTIPHNQCNFFIFIYFQFNLILQISCLIMIKISISNKCECRILEWSFDLVIYLEIRIAGKLCSVVCSWLCWHLRVNRTEKITKIVTLGLIDQIL